MFATCYTRPKHLGLFTLSLVMTCRSAHYGLGKKLRDDSWKGIGDDIMRRLTCGDLHDEVQTLSFKGKLMTRQGWRMLEHVLPKLTACFVLELSCCGISNVTPLIAMMPKLSRMCKCFDLGGNNLSSESVSLIIEAMKKQFCDIRPTWLAIGDDACDAACKYLHDPLKCNPHYKKGCLHAQHSVVHVVRKLSGFRRKETVTKKRDMKVGGCQISADDSKEEWPKLISEKESTATPPDEVIDSDDSFVPSDAMDIAKAFKLYIKAQHTAVKLDMLQLWSSLGPYIVAPLSVAARFSHDHARASLKILTDSFAEGLTSFLIGENMYILATAEGRLTFVDLSTSVQMGALVDSQGRYAEDVTPLQNFQYVVEADAHEAGQYELNTLGGESLSISLQLTDYLLSGWVVCDGLWFPMRKCKM